MHGCWRTLFTLITLLLLGVATFLPESGAAEARVLRPGPLAAIEQAITNAIARKDLPGAVVWVERAGTNHRQALGNRAVSPAVEPMTEDTLFDVASLTKVIATTPSILLLQERGQLDLGAPVRRYLPEFRGENTERIVVRHLLTHTSGLRPGLPSQPDWSGYEKGIAMACQEKATNAPGTVFRYSDINFILLGEVVRRVSGRPLAEFAAREIFEPLGMAATGFRPAAEISPRIAPTEQTTNGMLRGVVHDPTARRMGGVAGHAGLFTTASDLARYARMLLNEGTLEGVQVFRPETVRLMTSVQSPTAVPARRGLGWDIDSPYSRPRGTLFPRGSFGHTGWTGTALWIDPFSKTFYIFLSNRVHPDGQGNVLSLYSTLGTLAAQAVEDFDFAAVAGALPFRTNFIASAGSSKAAAPPGVLNGIDVLVRDRFVPLRRLRVGLVTNHTGQDRHRNPTIDLLHGAPEVGLVSLFSPEHGLRGLLDESVGDSVDERTGLPVYSLYPKLPARRRDQSEADYNRAANLLRAPPAAALTNLDALVFDIQDVGCRFYTYVATLGLTLEAASRAGLQLFVLDRVNPIQAGVVEGPVHHGDPLFIAWHALPLRHGMTLGELARLFNAELRLNARLTVIPVEGWKRSTWFDGTGLPWRNPSPNMRSLNAALLYPGIGLHETAISVGRGTDTPFELVGAPYIDDLRLAFEMNGAGLSGIRFIPARFTPTASVHKGVECGGVQMVITDRDRLSSVDVGVQLALTLHRLYPAEYPVGKLQTLLRDPQTLTAIEAGQPLASIRQLWAADLAEFRTRRAPHLLYGE